MVPMVSLASSKDSQFAPRWHHWLGNLNFQSQIVDKNWKTLSRKAINYESTKGLDDYSHLVSRIVKDSYLKMCMQSWNGNGGLRGYLEMLRTCSVAILKNRLDLKCCSLSFIGINLRDILQDIQAKLQWRSKIWLQREILQTMGVQTTPGHTVRIGNQTARLLSMDWQLWSPQKGESSSDFLSIYCSGTDWLKFHWLQFAMVKIWFQDLPSA